MRISVLQQSHLAYWLLRKEIMNPEIDALAQPSWKFETKSSNTPTFPTGCETDQSVPPIILLKKVIVAKETLLMPKYLICLHLGVGWPRWA